MSRDTLDADAIMARATPITRQQAHEIQPYGHLVRMPIALSETACKESVENLNQILADTIALRDLYKKHHWQVAGPSRLVGDIRATYDTMPAPEHTRDHAAGEE